MAGVGLTSLRVWHKLESLEAGGGVIFECKRKKINRHYD